MRIKKSVFMILVVVLMACTPHNNSASTANANNTISGDDVNKTIVASAPDGWNDYKFGAVKLLVSLKSGNTVILDDHNVKIFINKDNEWTPIENQNSFPGTTYIIEPIGTPAFRSAQVLAIPDLKGQTNEVVLRIVVSANIYDNKVLGKQVLAFVDVTLYPR